MPQILETWKICHYMLRGCQMSYSHKFGVLGANVDPQSWTAT